MNQKLQDKLYNHPSSVDVDEIWNGIQEKKKRRFLPYFWFGLGALAVGVYFLSSYSISNRNDIISEAKNQETTNIANRDFQGANEKTATLDDIEIPQSTAELEHDNSQSIENEESISSENVREISKAKNPTHNSNFNINNNKEYSKDNIFDVSKNTSKYIPTSSLNIQKSVKTVAPARSSQLSSAKSSEEDRISVNIDELSPLPYLQIIQNSRQNIESSDIKIVKKPANHEFTAHLGTIISENDLDAFTIALPGIDAALIYNRHLGPKLKLGLGVNYTQFREHITTSYSYTQSNEVNDITTVYRQDGSVETINSLVTVLDTYERSLSKVNKKNRVDLNLRSDYSLFSVGKLSTSVNGQLAYNLLSWNRGLEIREDYEGVYDISIDENNIINSDNRLSYRFGLGIDYSLSRELSIGLAVQRFSMLNSFYIDQESKYKGFNGGLSINYRM